MSCHWNNGTIHSKLSFGGNGNRLQNSPNARASVKEESDLFFFLMYIALCQFVVLDICKYYLYIFMKYNIDIVVLHECCLCVVICTEYFSVVVTVLNVR